VKLRIERRKLKCTHSIYGPRSSPSMRSTLCLYIFRWRCSSWASRSTTLRTSPGEPFSRRLGYLQFSGRGGYVHSRRHDRTIGLAVATGRTPAPRHSPEVPSSRRNFCGSNVAGPVAPLPRGALGTPSAGISLAGRSASSGDRRAHWAPWRIFEWGECTRLILPILFCSSCPDRQTPVQARGGMRKLSKRS